MHCTLYMHVKSLGETFQANPECNRHYIRQTFADCHKTIDTNRRSFAKHSGETSKLQSGFGENFRNIPTIPSGSERTSYIRSETCRQSEKISLSFSHTLVLWVWATRTHSPIRRSCLLLILLLLLLLLLLLRLLLNPRPACSSPHPWPLPSQHGYAPHHCRSFGVLPPSLY